MDNVWVKVDATQTISVKSRKKKNIALIHWTAKERELVMIYTNVMVRICVNEKE